jgi:hypothetical protein
MQNMKRRVPLVLVLTLSLWPTVSVVAEDSIEQLKSRSEACADSSEAGGYGAEAIQEFWGDVGFMVDCAPPGKKSLERLTIYVKVNPDGSIGQLEIVPSTQVAECIRRHVQDRTLPEPPFENYVFQVSLSFD